MDTERKLVMVRALVATAGLLVAGICVTLVVFVELAGCATESVPVGLERGLESSDLLRFSVLEELFEVDLISSE